MFIQREPQDTAKIRRLAIAATLIVAGITCLVLAFRPAGGTMLIRPGVTLVVLGFIWLKKGERAKASDPNFVLSDLMGKSRTAAPGDNPVRPAMIRRVMLIMGIGLAATLATIIVMNVGRTVMLSAELVPPSGTMFVILIGFSAITGWFWARGIGKGAFKAAFMAPLYGFIVLSLFLAPALFLPEILAETWVFAGQPKTVMTPLRIVGVYDRHGKGGATYYAQVDPFHSITHERPKLQIGFGEMMRIKAALVDAPVDPMFPGWPRGKTSPLCITLPVQHVGAAARAVLPVHGALPDAMVQNCPG